MARPKCRVAAAAASPRPSARRPQHQLATPPLARCPSVVPFVADSPSPPPLPPLHLDRPTQQLFLTDGQKQNWGRRASLSYIVASSSLVPHSLSAAHVACPRWRRRRGRGRRASERGASLLEVWRRNIHGISRIIHGMRGRGRAARASLSPLSRAMVNLQYAKHHTIVRLLRSTFHAAMSPPPPCICCDHLIPSSFVEKDMCRCRTTLTGPFVTIATPRRLSCFHQSVIAGIHQLPLGRNRDPPSLPPRNKSCRFLSSDGHITCAMCM